MHKHQGFTLIELVIVIILLGMLSAVAVPKFVDLQDDAEDATGKNNLAVLSTNSMLVDMKEKIDEN